MKEQKKNITASNFIWRVMERFGAQGVTLLVSVVLARLLDPEVYGTVALITVITTILQVFLEAGLSQALIQKKDADEVDFSSVFYFNIVFGIILYGLLFLAAPLIAKFYKMPDLTPVIRVLGLTLLIFAVKSLQQAYVSRHLMFKKFFFATLGGTIGAAAVGIFIAYKGGGVWALVAQHLFNMFIDTVILWFTVKWRPKVVFSWARLKILLSYGWKLFVSHLIDVVYTDLRQLIIGKMYTKSDLAYYNQGSKYTHAFVTSINSSLDSVLLPVMSNVQDSVEKVRFLTRKAIKTSTFLIMPIMMGFAVCAAPAVDLILTSKWLPCVPYLRVFCFTYAFYPLHTANLNAIKALGRSDLFLKLEIIKKIVGMVALACTIWFGPMVMAYSLMVTSIASQIINSWPNKKLLGYSYPDQLRDMLPQILLSVVMGAIVFSVTLFKLSDIVTLLIQVPLGVLIYMGGAKLLHLEALEMMIELAGSLLKKVRKKGRSGAEDGGSL